MRRRNLPPRTFSERPRPFTAGSPRRTWMATLSNLEYGLVSKPGQRDELTFVGDPRGRSSTSHSFWTRIRRRGATRYSSSASGSYNDFEISSEQPANGDQGETEYQECALDVPIGRSLLDLTVAETGRLALAVVEAEGPIHLEEVARRIREAFGLQKTGNRILKHVRDALVKLSRSEMVIREDEFWSNSGPRSSSNSDSPACGSATPPSKHDLSCGIRARDYGRHRRV